MSQKKKEQKKKERERTSRKKVLERRVKLQAKRKEDAARERAQDLEADPTLATKKVPFMKEETKEEMIKRRLAHNMKILEALEKEYLAEIEARHQINKDLESQGHLTIREKLDALQEQALEIMEANGIELEAHKEQQKILLESDPINNNLNPSEEISIIVP